MATLPLAPPDNFHLFPRLPKELRSRIWKFAAFEPRLLNIRFFPPGSVEIQYFFSSDPAPAILRTCQESRSEALAFYTKAFSTGTTQRYIWTNFNVDTIKIEDYCLSKVNQEERARIRWLIVEANDTELFIWYYYPWDYEKMKELRDLVISSTPKVSQWGFLIGTMRSDFEEWFGGVEGWKCPEMRIVEKGTGIEMNFQNFQAMSARGRGRGSLRGGGRGRGGNIGRGGGESSLS